LDNSQKMGVDFWRTVSLDSGMINLDEIDPRKARSGLFALVTARLEDAHELAVRGQNPKLGQNETLSLLEEIADQTNQIEVLLMAIRTIRE